MDEILLTGIRIYVSEWVRGYDFYSLRGTRKIVDYVNATKLILMIEVLSVYIEIIYGCRPLIRVNINSKKLRPK